MVIFHSYVNLPEGMFFKTIFSPSFSPFFRRHLLGFLGIPSHFETKQEQRKERRQLQEQRADLLAMGFQNSNEENQDVAGGCRRLHPSVGMMKSPKFDG